MRLKSVLRGPSRSVVVVAAAIAFAAGLAGCTSSAPPAPTESPVTSAPPTTAADPVLQPNGTAADNKPYFDFIVQRTVAADSSAGGQAITSALRDGGFNIGDMQVTVDTTTVGVKADTVQFSLLWKGQCIVGQYGFTGYTSSVLPVLGTGKCMVGDTRPIDW